MRNALATTTGSLESDWKMGYAYSGRPIIEKGPASNAGLRISLSHSGPITVAAVTDAESVGVDIELLRERRYGQIAEYLKWSTFVPEVPTDMAQNQFFHLWTLWEACLKATPDANLLRPTAAFCALAPQAIVGHPTRLEGGAWHAESWVNPDYFWLTVVHDAQQPAALRIIAAERENHTETNIFGPRPLLSGVSGHASNGIISSH
jgi:phosphopantetheinyl transferase